MSQEEVLNWLKAHPGWHRRKEILEALDAPKISDTLKRLRKWGQIERRTNKERLIEYRYKED